MMEAPPGIEPGFTALQAAASPLRHGASVVKALTYSDAASCGQYALMDIAAVAAPRARAAHCAAAKRRDIRPDPWQEIRLP